MEFFWKNKNCKNLIEIKFYLFLFHEKNILLLQFISEATFVVYDLKKVPEGTKDI